MWVDGDEAKCVDYGEIPPNTSGRRMRLSIWSMRTSQRLPVVACALVDALW